MEEEMELEEGEAYYSYHNHNDSNVDDKSDNCIDPDVAFSYMDVKIRDVLGQFQKDFEGGVSAENLGPKFGGYGSFLPTYQRSPVCSQLRSSPTPSPLEDPCRNGAVSEAISERHSHGPVKKSYAVVISRSKERSMDSSKQEKWMPALRTVEDENSYKFANRKSSVSIPDQKMLKLRIKIGSSDNSSTQNKAALYSGLGLDASPSSLLDESPSESEGMSCGHVVMGFDSPTSIIQTMTSCPLNGDKLLSPLSDDLIHFSEKKKPLEGQKGEKLLDKKILKSVEKKDAPLESKCRVSKKSKRKEMDVDSLACEDLILKTLELPIISGAEGNVTSARVENFADQTQRGLSHYAGKISGDERGTREPEINFLAPKEKKDLNTERPSSMGKKKLKGSQNEGFKLADPAKESLRGSSLVNKSKKSIGVDISMSVRENNELKSMKVLEKGSDIYRDFFGEFEQEAENQAGELGPDAGNEDSGPVENKTNLKDGASGNIIANVSASEMHFDAAPDVPPAASVAPVVIQENWVCCDKCEKWRLLPVGKDPKDLPKKWLCSMLDWLPGKNRCSVSEIETNAVLSQSYALAPTSQNNGPLSSANSSLPFAATMVDPDENRLIHTPEGPSVSGKKKHGMKQVIHQSVAGGPDDSEQASKSKQRAYERHPDGGDANTSRLSKKVWNKDIQSADEDRRSAGGSGSRKLGKNGNSNDRAHTFKPDSADEAPVKQQRESLESGNSDVGKSVLKKRNHDQDSEAFNRDNNEHRKEKKARVTKSERKESSEKCGSDGTMKSTRKEKKPLVFPTSSSYKASKSKGSFQEVKGSPAESVSSSPMKSLKPDKLAPMVRNALDSDEKEKNQIPKYESETEKGKASSGEVKRRDCERTKIRDKSAGNFDSIGEPCGNDEKSSKRGSSGKADQSGNEARMKKSRALPPSGATLTDAPQLSTKLKSEPTKVNKASNPSQMTIAANGTRHPSDRRDFAHAAASAIKEAKDLKHMADRVMASGSNLDGIGLYFQAALKFLYGASLLESSLNASSKYSEMMQLIETYSSTAKLHEFCAREYEKSKDMASAVLAYKCMEVAYMKVVYTSQNTAIKDRQELQTALKLVPPGESPSSSVSDVDHVNNSAAVDNKATLPKDENPAQVAENRIITAQNRPSFERLLNFAQNVNSAMEACGKSMAAFNAASSKSADSQYKEVISSIKQAMDFNFQDVEGFLQLVRIAKEAISR